MIEEHPSPAQTSNTRIESSDSGRGHLSMDTSVGIQVKCEQKIKNNKKGPQVFNRNISLLIYIVDGDHQCAGNCRTC